MSPDWPNRCTPRHAIRPAEEGERVRVAVDQRHDRDVVREQPLERARVALAQPGARLERAEQQVRARDADDLRGDPGLRGQQCPPPPAPPARARP